MTIYNIIDVNIWRNHLTISRSISEFDIKCAFDQQVEFWLKSSLDREKWTLLIGLRNYWPHCHTGGKHFKHLFWKTKASENLSSTGFPTTQTWQTRLHTWQVKKVKRIKNGVQNQE